MVEIVTGKEILFGTPNDFTDLVGAIAKEWRTAGEESVWFNPATWKVFDFIGDLQARAFVQNIVSDPRRYLEEIDMCRVTDYT